MPESPPDDKKSNPKGLLPRQIVGLILICVPIASILILGLAMGHACHAGNKRSCSSLDAIAVLGLFGLAPVLMGLVLTCASREKTLFNILVGGGPKKTRRP